MRSLGGAVHGQVIVFIDGCESGLRFQKCSVLHFRGQTIRPHNMRFKDMVTLLEAFGFRLSRVKGSHHIFVHPQVRELINIQDVAGQAKPYQVRQFLQLVERYNLELGDE